MKVLAIGATGSSAGQVVGELSKRGVAVRGVVHDPARSDDARRNGAHEVVVADLNDLDALTTAATGCDGVFGVIPAFAEDEAGIGTNMVTAAVRAGARKFVFSSVYHPSTTALSNHRNKQPAEAALYDSDLDFTILQPAMFLSQLTPLYQAARKTGTITQPYSAESKMAYVDYADVAEVAARAFVTDRFSYGTFELAAPGMYDRHDLAELFGKALGRHIGVERPDFDAWADSVQMPAGGLRDGLRTMNEHYDRCGFHGGNPLVLTAMLERPPVTVASMIDRLSQT